VRRYGELTDQSTQRLLLEAGSVRKHHRPVTRIVTSCGRQTLLSDHVAANGDLVLLRVDLSGQHAIDREMRRRLRRLDDLCNAAFRWTWRTDRKGRLIESQPSLPGAAASPLAPFVGKHLLEALADADAEAVGEQMDAQQPIPLASARLTRGAHELRCTLAATPVIDDRDEFDGFFGALHAVFIATVLVSVLLPVVHPRMATPDTAANDTTLIEPPGFLMLNYGRNTFLVTLVAHIVYGGNTKAQEAATLRISSKSAVNQTSSPPPPIRRVLIPSTR